MRAIISGTCRDNDATAEQRGKAEGSDDTAKCT
jgi:hypothetical protein